MDLDLTPDQKLLREATARFMEARLPASRVREPVDRGRSPDDDERSRAAELGWFASLARQDLGGGEVCPDRACLTLHVLAEKRGWVLQLGSFIDTNVTVAALAAQGSDDHRSEVTPALISGGCSAVCALADPRGDWSGRAGVSCAADLRVIDWTALRAVLWRHKPRRGCSLRLRWRKI